MIRRFWERWTAPWPASWVVWIRAASLVKNWNRQYCWACEKTVQTHLFIAEVPLRHFVVEIVVYRARAFVAILPEIRQVRCSVAQAGGAGACDSKEEMHTFGTPYRFLEIP